MTHDVSIRAPFERFPATVKGAFVLRGEGRDPHQVRIEQARVTEVGARSGRSIGVAPATLEVAPHLDLFVPFEFSAMDLEPGWYGLDCDVVVDGVPETVHPGRRFSIPWPRSAIRRGTVPVGKSVAAGDGKVEIEQIECLGDHIRISYRADELVRLRVSSGDVRVPVLEEEFDEEHAHGVVTAYPALREWGSLTVEAAAGGTIDVVLP
jgi:hypothetical protein